MRPGTRSGWEHRVTELVDATAGPGFDWDGVPPGDWDAAWLARQSAESFAAELVGCTEAELVDPNATE